MRTLELTIPEAFVDLFEPARNKAYYGGRGSAKSHSFAEALVAITSRQQKRVVCGRQFQNSIHDSVKELIEQKIYKLNVADSFKILEREIIHRSTRSRFSFIGLDRNPESQKSLEGADIFWGEEAQTFSNKSIEMIIPTIRRPGSELWWSWNPRFANDPVDKKFRSGEKPPRSIVKFVSYKDNPYFFQTELAEEMLFMKKHNPKRWEHVWMGGYDDNSDAQIFKNTRIGRVEIPDYVHPRFGLDFGYSSDPNALVKVYVIHETKTIYIAQEAYGYHVSMIGLPDLLDTVTETRDYPIVCDSGRPDNIDHLCLSNFNAYGARKPQGSIKSGIHWLQGFDIVIDPDCVNLQEEARLYRWKLDPKDDKPLPIPIDAFNHGWDAVRYACEDEILSLHNDKDGGVLKFPHRRTR